MIAAPSFPNQTSVLGIFAKQPLPGLVKTRLAAATNTHFAAQVAEACLHDTLAKFQDLPCRRLLLVAPDGALDYFKPIAVGYEVATQGPGDLGERLQRFFQSSFAAGATRVVAIGADSPSLPKAYVVQAFASVHTRDVAIGPAMDGGYYLLACSRFMPELLQGIDWGSEHVLRQTLECVEQGDYSADLLPPWYDVDTLEDWRFLVTHLRRAGLEAGCHHLWELIRRGQWC